MKLSVRFQVYTNCVCVCVRARSRIHTYVVRIVTQLYMEEMKLKFLILGCCMDRVSWLATGFWGNFIGC